MQFDYYAPAKFVLDRVRFVYEGQAYNGQGFIEWEPKSGFHIDALLNKTFNPVDALKTAGQIIIHTSDDTFQIKLVIRGVGFAIARAFPLAQKKTIFPDNHLSMELERIVFFTRWPQNTRTQSNFWTGSAEFLTSRKLEFPDHMNTETTLGGKPYGGSNKTGLAFQDDDNWCITGQSVSDDKFELSWALNKNRWKRNDVWRFGEAARRALAIVSAQTIWIAKLSVARDVQTIQDVRRRSKPKKLSYTVQPMLGDAAGAVNSWNFNKVAFLKLTEFFLGGSPNAEVCWKIFCQLADASQQNSTQAKELLSATILEAIFRTINNRPFKVGDYYPEKKRRADMVKFRDEFFDANWTKACDKALELHEELRHRNAHPDWLTSPDGALSKPEVKKSTASLIFLSRFYGYMILAMAGFKDMKPMFPSKIFADE